MQDLRTRIQDMTTEITNLKFKILTLENNMQLHLQVMEKHLEKYHHFRAGVDKDERS